MEKIETFLVDLLGPAGPLIAIGGIGLLLVIFTLPFVLSKPKDPFANLDDTKRTRRNRSDEITLRANVKNEKLDKFSDFLEPQDEDEYNSVRMRLMQAGYRTKDAVRMFHLLQFGFGLLGLFGSVAYVLYFNSTSDEPLPTGKLVQILLLPGAILYLIPKYWVTRRVQERREEIINGFPDALDMMLVCVEAGQSLDQAIIRVADEIRAGFPSLADEFQIVAFELKAGKDRERVLKDMGERTGVQDVASFVTVMVQSQAFGTSIGEALRVYAGEMRDKRVMRAEEKANKVPTKMTLATMMLTVPPLLIAIIGPSVYGMIQNFGKLMGG